MDDMIEISELDMGNDFGFKKGSNFGGGIELLISMT